jgi:hypothetical protein
MTPVIIRITDKSLIQENDSLKIKTIFFYIHQCCKRYQYFLNIKNRLTTNLLIIMIYIKISYKQPLIERDRGNRPNDVRQPPYKRNGAKSCRMTLSF